MLAQTSTSEKEMKRKICFVLSLAWASGFAFAAATDLKSELQKGLFEEEGNHALNAAIAAYQEVASKFDQNRQLAATAIFRLGECFRKQGSTNEASRYYERILSEFPDQTNLVKAVHQLGVV